MKLRSLLVVGIATGIAGCAEKEQAVPSAAEEPAVETQAIAPRVEDWRDPEFLEHMHKHAEQLDDLNFALDDGDLERAATPAYWLSQHDTATGIPSELQPIVYRMREAAGVVEAAEDIATARAAAQQISEQCLECHTKMGVIPE